MPDVQGTGKSFDVSNWGIYNYKKRKHKNEAAFEPLKQIYLFIYFWSTM